MEKKKKTKWKNKSTIRKSIEVRGTIISHQKYTEGLFPNKNCICDPLNAATMNW